MANLFTHTFKTPYLFTHTFTNLVIMAKRIEQAIKTEKTKGPSMSSRVIIEGESENGPQLG